MQVIEFRGQKYNLSELARRMSIPRHTLSYRLKQGYTLEEIAKVGSNHMKLTDMGRRSINNKLSTEQAERLVKAKAAGATYAELVERFGVCKMTVHRTLKKASASHE